jgi:hypothetical protein
MLVVKFTPTTSSSYRKCQCDSIGCKNTSSGEKGKSEIKHGQRYIGLVITHLFCFTLVYFILS